MKKTLFTLMLMIASAFAINAQSLTGKEWCTMIPDEDGNQIALEMTFKDNGSCEIELVAVEEMKEIGAKLIIEVEIDIPGTYTLKEDNLNVTLIKEKAKVDFDVDIEGVDAQTKALMKQMIKPELEKNKEEVINESLKSLPALGEMKVVSLDNNRLVLTDASGTKMDFYAKKD